ncbi:sulfatase maturation enzyme AslB (radical SAM superfamily) [Kitasatospora gansuensis]|uniref:Sulfatase maturation enzyme AslB (Radical SAM superfamily) n=1 Tax=Kitasatospora gansuensis TaxID=258050 RepID=A0A7W7WLD1_9ACTN|nr:sulfatase maturation enzyme AslB (radical SAM superfamily) [Kitasatospora gansuensis]
MSRPPAPFSQFVLKVHSRCDLSCDHCYVYEHADTSWRGKPRTVSERVLAATADRIAEHALAHRLTAVHVVLHGGEPLLAGPAVLAAVELLRRPAYRHLYAGLLCTIDVENDPVAVYDALVELAPPRIDFLLPHATWDDPPKRPSGAGPAPYADWLLAIHRRWTAQGRPVPVRIFDSVHRTLRGRSSLTESLGLDPADLVVVETDGTLEQADSLKTAYDGAPETGFDVSGIAFVLNSLQRTQWEPLL